MYYTVFFVYIYTVYVYIFLIERGFLCWLVQRITLYFIAGLWLYDPLPAFFQHEDKLNIELIDLSKETRRYFCKGHEYSKKRGIDDFLPDPIELFQ